MSAIPLANEPMATPSIRQLIMLGSVAGFLRVAIFFTASLTGHLSLANYTTKADSASYIAYASAIDGDRSFQSLDEYDRRVFPSCIVWGFLWRSLLCL
jgi:hypothetical protein